MDFEQLQKISFNFSNIASTKQIWHNNEAYSYMDNPRPSNGLTYILCRKVIYHLENGTILTAQKGDIVFLPKGTRYSTTFLTDTPEEHASTLINFRLFDDNNCDIHMTDGICIFGMQQNLSGYFDEIANIYTNYVYPHNKLKVLLYQLISKLHDSVLSTKEITPIEKTLLYINNNLTEHLYISEIAKMCAMSESSFRIEFKNETGLSPNKYISNAKIKKAQELLSNLEISVNDISASLNFYDPAYFCKVFKKATGMTPSQYRLSL